MFLLNILEAVLAYDLVKIRFIKEKEAVLNGNTNDKSRGIQLIGPGYLQKVIKGVNWLLSPIIIILFQNEKWGYVGRDTVILEKTEKGGASIKFVNGLAIPDGPIQRVHTNVIYFNKPRPKQIPRQTM